MFSASDATGYVCAFRGRRDAYQVPLALAEGNILDQFITDAYATPALKAILSCGPASLRSFAAFRSESGLPAERVRCLWASTVVEHFRHSLGYSAELTFNLHDRHYGHAAGRRAAKSRSHLLMYSPYAWEAFTRSYSHTPRKILFQYHPHQDLEQRLLNADALVYPDYVAGTDVAVGETLPSELAHRNRDVWRHSDLIFCASSFTSRSLEEAGADSRLCRIVPYGVGVSECREAAPTRNFEVVFVGTGSRRKGLHHLLLAWQRSKLPPESRLTLVCRAIDPAIEKLARAIPNVQVSIGVSGDQLNQIYASSTLLTMPSLVEGFGQVYLEALAQGCPVLGTANSCLPDLGGEEQGIFLVAMAQVEELTARLETLAAMLPNRPDLRTAARKCAQRYTWESFRTRIRETLSE